MLWTLDLRIPVIFHISGCWPQIQVRGRNDPACWTGCLGCTYYNEYTVICNRYLEIQYMWFIFFYLCFASFSSFLHLFFSSSILFFIYSFHPFFSYFYHFFFSFHFLVVSHCFHVTNRSTGCSYLLSSSWLLRYDQWGQNCWHCFKSIIRSYLSTHRYQDYSP